MANSEHLEILNKGVEVWNEWREEHKDIKPDLRTANLEAANLEAADLYNTDLYNANLNNANLNDAVLSSANLSRANFFDTNLIDANLFGANLTNAMLIFANLTDANLTNANLTNAILSFTAFTNANLTNANLTKSIMGFTILAFTDLSTVKGLETIIPMGPSSIDSNTIEKSGELPLKFLQGIGLKDWQIEAAKLSKSGISRQEIKSISSNILEMRLVKPKYYSCFISYSHKDEEFAQRIFSNLQDAGVSCYYAPKDMEGGKTLYSQVKKGIREKEKLLLILSENSLHSNWVETEIKEARKIEGKQMLYPISITNFKNIEDWERFDSKTGTSLSDEVKSYFIPDFSKKESYQAEFDRLLKSLEVK